jgi:hypothetical protein
MLRHIVLTAGTGVAVCALAVCLTASLAPARSAAPRQGSTLEKAGTTVQMAVRRSGYIVASS